MSRLIDQPVQVVMQGHRPRAFKWRGQWHYIERFLDYWIETGEWWKSPRRSPETHVLRVLSKTGGLFEIEYSQGSWKLYKIYD